MRYYHNQNQQQQPTSSPISKNIKNFNGVNNNASSRNANENGVDDRSRRNVGAVNNIVNNLNIKQAVSEVVHFDGTAMMTPRERNFNVTNNNNNN